MTYGMLMPAEGTDTVLSRATLVRGLLLACSAAQAGFAFGSAHVLVVDEASGEVLLSKDADTAAPIASLTKLMTTMVALDAQQAGRVGTRGANRRTEPWQATARGRGRRRR